jgi:hypothetical protein
MITDRVPFEFTLVDKRHKPFVEGERNNLRSLAQYILYPGFIFAAIMGGMGLLFFMRMGISGLAYNFSVRNDWVTTEATIVAIVPVQFGDRFNWHYMYTFQTDDGQQGSGKIVEDNKYEFSEGQMVPVRYLRTNPKENVYANERMPKSVLYWVLVGIGSLWVYVCAKLMYRHFSEYITIKGFSQKGTAVPGRIVEIKFPPWHSDNKNVEIEYTFNALDGTWWKRRDSISLLYLVGKPEPGTTVAVWWVTDEVAVLL